MSHFLELVMPEYSTDGDLLNTLPECAICVCCLAQNVTFINLTTCKHTVFLNFIKYKMQYTNMLICHHCHSILKKIQDFKQQVEESILVLNKQALLHLQKNKLYNLQCSETQINVTINPEITSNTIKNEQELNNKCKVTDSEMVSDIKVESDISDMETDMPLSEIKRQKNSGVRCHVVKKEIKTKPIKREKAVDSPLIGEKYIGKLEMLLLTQDELQKERQLLRKDDKYLKLPFKCEQCIIGFNRELYLKKHLKQRHEKSVGKYICGICETVFGSKVALNPHYRRHFIRYECKTCGKRYIDERSVVSHYNEKHDKEGAIVHNKYQCKIADCGFETHSHRSFMYHRSKHKQYPCTLCGKVYIKWVQLRSHIYGVHNQPPTIFKCDKCEKQYKQRCGLRLHMQSAHGGAERAPYCVACRMHFRTNNILQHHLRHHSNHVTEADKKFMCDECGARFSTKTYLKGHIEWVHLKKSEYQCPQCFKTLKTVKSLQRHIDFVHEKKVLPRDKMCDYCGKGFVTRRCLLAHIRTHTGERPYRCSQCGATFTQSASLYNHKRLVHNPLRGEATRRRGNKTAAVGEYGPLFQCV